MTPVLAAVSRMRPREQDFDGTLDELELGERVADALFVELAGSIYTNVKDRAWAVVLCCYRRWIDAVGNSAGVPAGWTPVFDENGNWSMPGAES